MLEFVLFKERLERAHSYALCRAESAILTMRQRLAAPAAAPAAPPAAAPAPGGAAQAAPGPAAAAAAALPLAELAGAPWRAMRFNADLQTRPPWLPPAACAPHLAVMRWWEDGAAEARRARWVARCLTSFSEPRPARAPGASRRGPARSDLIWRDLA